MTTKKSDTKKTSAESSPPGTMLALKAMFLMGGALTAIWVLSDHSVVQSIGEANSVAASLSLFCTCIAYTAHQAYRCHLAEGRAF